MHNITYTYDPVGNITRISNAAGGADGLGGSFTYNYSYDDLYRLSSSDGSGAIDAAYTLAMEYSPSGNILKKTLAASKEILGNATMESYENEYSYGGAHTLAGVNDLLGGAPPLTYNFDGSGNMVMQQLYNPSNGQVNERYLCWDEENRLSATRDNNYVTANIYDASGNRAWKIAGEMNWMWQNGSGWQGYGDLNLRTWYQSELMTITDVGFTKHYFIAGQKIVSKLGEGFSNSDELHPLKGAPLEPIYSDYTELARAQVNRLQRDFDCLGVSYGNFNPGEGNIRLLDDYEVIEIGEESDIYFYHSDHLGSSSFLTDGGGVATQHLQYMPFGEDLVHQQNTAAYYTPYTFSGKERDMETGLSYFGARYYDAGLSIWLSVDPMSDKAPSWTPYRYGFQNPVKYIDPTGLLESETGGDPPKKAQTQPSLDGIGFKPPQNLPLENTPLTGSTPMDNVVVAPTSIKPSTGTKTSSLSMEKLAYADPVAAILAVCEIATENKNVSNYLGKIRGGMGPLITIVGAANVHFDYQKTNLPEGDPNRMTNAQFTYNFAAFGTSTLTGFVVGGPPGVVAGTLVGGTFWAGEQLYDGINWGIGEISNGVASFENALNQGWIPKGF